MELETKAIPEKKRVMTSFEIGELKEPWERYCAAHDVTSVEALCRVIQKLTGSPDSKLPDSARKSAARVTRPGRAFRTTEGSEKRQHRLYLTLTKSELDAVEARATADGFDKPTAWAVALVRARLTDEAQFGTREIEILGESNHQLLAIGRNLNQIAHALNATRGKSIEQYDAELVESLADAVKRHVRKVGDALRSSIHRWTLEEVRGSDEQ